MERLARESSFHDQRFADDTRRQADKFYQVSGSAFAWYRSRVLADVAALRVLEYGCGLGTSALDVARAGGNATGIDISPVAIGLARQEATEAGLQQRAEFAVMNAEALECADASFDRVCGSGILHHLDLSRALPEIARVLAPGGYAVFLEPLGHNPAINWYRRRTPTLRTEDEHPLLMRDLRFARTCFGQVRVRFFNLATLLAVPLRTTVLFSPAMSVLTAIDKLLLAARSPARHWAWMVVVEFAH